MHSVFIGGVFVAGDGDSNVSAEAHAVKPSRDRASVDFASMEFASMLVFSIPDDAHHLDWRLTHI
jgi:hypothetical protein